MQSINSSNYSIYFSDFGYENLNLLLEKNNYSTIFILTDQNSNENCLPILLNNLSTEIRIEIIEIEPGESEKNINTCIEIWKILTELKADRKSVLINLGGGVITDLGGFIASTFKRGIDFINIPTTLLSMVDASIGGKNGIDLDNLKNQIGIINNPKMVLVDSVFLETLPSNEMRSGLAEMLKHGLIYDKNYWNKFLDLSNLDLSELDELIYRSIEIKNEIVTQDPNESGIRKALNFGHTIGHAIESYFLENKNKESILHGEAVAIGMIIESNLSFQKKLLNLEDYKSIKETILSIFDKVHFEESDINEIMKLLIHDKKNEYGKVQFTMLNKIGNTCLNQYSDNETITKSFIDYNS